MSRQGCNLKSVEFLIEKCSKDEYPALVVGKGPTSGQIDAALSWFKGHVFTMNHAIRLVKSACAAHFIDIEAYLDCADDVAANARYLIMPERPHEKMTEARHISEVMKTYPKLADMEKQGRLVTYRKIACKVGLAPPRTVSCLYFSAEALFNVIGLIGIKRVFSIGIDGGNQYSSQFKDLKPLTNGQQSFDVQIPELYRIAVHHGFIWDRLYQEGRYHGT